MTTRKNEFDQPIGAALDFTGPWPGPDGRDLNGQYCRLVKSHASHAQGLYNAFCQDQSGKNWTYMPYDPMSDFAAFEDWFLNTCFGDDPFFYTVLNAEDAPLGVASYLRINQRDGSVEVGWISMSPLMQRSRISTEAMFLMMRHAFDDLGMRRYEWKCDTLNAPSRAAAARLGFTFEGNFRQCTHYKGRNRDTAWFSILDGEWPAQKERFQAYLDEANFDSDGQQLKGLDAG